MKTAYITYRQCRSLRESRKAIELATFPSSSRQANTAGEIWWVAKQKLRLFLIISHHCMNYKDKAPHNLLKAINLMKSIFI